MFNELFSKGGLSLERLRTFCAVAESGGVTKAAGGDPTRQSQFSRQIKELETFFGVGLTRRQGKFIVLSPAGMRLARVARESLVSLEDFQKACGDEPLESSIGAGDALLQWLLAPKFGTLRDSLPKVSFNIVSFRTLDIAERVTDQRLDFGLIRKDAVSPLHKHELLGLQTFALFVPTKLLSSDGRHDWKSVVSKIPLATIAGDGLFRGSLEKEADESKIPLNFSLSCSSFPLAAKALQSECYAAILPTIASTELDMSRFKSIAAPFLKRQAREICLIWNPRTESLRPEIAGIKERLVKTLRLPKA